MSRFVLCLAGLVVASAGLAADRPSAGRPMSNVLYTTRGAGGASVDAPGRSIEARKRYRACLFAYLPRVGSDVAANLLREACAEEFLSRDDRDRAEPARPDHP